MAATFAVAFELSRMGWLVAPTYGNAPKVDLLASRSEATVAIQVKTTTTPSRGWLLGKGKIEPNIIYVLVAVGKKKPPRYWLLKGSEVARYCDNHPTMNAIRFNKDEHLEFENRWSILDGYEGTTHYL